jgi:hypothetical protein
MNVGSRRERKMIAKVMQILEKPTTKGTKYLNVTLSVDGKKVVVNSFDTTDHVTFQQALEKGFFLNVEVEKNEKGYDNLKSVKFVADQVPPAIVPVTPKADLTPKVETPKVDSPPTISNQETGMWWKELGEAIRSGELDKSYPKSAVTIKTQYYRKMFNVLMLKTE